MAASESHKREFTLSGCAMSMYFLLLVWRNTIQKQLSEVFCKERFS